MPVEILENDDSLLVADDALRAFDNLLVDVLTTEDPGVVVVVDGRAVKERP